MTKRIDLTGQTFGRLMAVRFVERRGKATLWECHCVCGATMLAASYDLRSGNTRSCGCLRRDVLTAIGRRMKHGQCFSPEYRSWHSMKTRCLNPRHDGFARYGGRGIKVCERWVDDFSAFLADMGPKPTPTHTIERINVDGHYEPGNCRWATAREQQNNLRNNVMLTARGKTQSVSQWAHDVGLEAGVLHYRVRSGWAPERALTEPVRKLRHHQ